jgi:hypothetical protein
MVVLAKVKIGRKLSTPCSRIPARFIAKPKAAYPETPEKQNVSPEISPNTQK